VWKVSYRLDLDGAQPRFQGWAIVDNDSDTDWNNVEISLVTGRPVSFIQNLYPPYYLSRPVLPLAIAGLAEARTYDSGYGAEADAAREKLMMEEASEVPAPLNRARSAAAGLSFSEASAAPAAQGALAQAAGDQFSFTLREPVSLPRQQSAMLPLVGGTIRAEKVLVLSGSLAARGLVHPAISAELTNTTGMKLPAGPITVFDGGTYGGDSLMAFFPENEKRLISYGEDLSVTASALFSDTRTISAVTVAGGVMTITRKLSYIRTYHVRNASGDAKTLIIEHPITGGTTLRDGQSFAERTDTLYRFRNTLTPNGDLEFTVVEEAPIAERVVLSRFTLDSYLSYTSNQEIPRPVQDALRRAVELKGRAEDAKSALSELEARRTALAGEQDRIRRNLEAAGSQTQQGMEYLRRMTEMDREFDSLASRIEAAQIQVRDTQNAYDQYLASLSL
jgi:hypothetical protein